MSPHTQKAHTITASKDEGFPFKAILLAALLPSLFGLCCGLFVMRPVIRYDTSVGLAAWNNYTTGGTWNTVARVDPENIHNTIEESVTWWPPGQYLPLGILQSAGLSVGAAVLTVAFFSTLSLGIGGAILVKELSPGGGVRILPWVSAGFSCSYYALINFNHFIGGETGLMAILPWVVLIAWKLRNRNLLLVLFLPPIFLLGSFIKHSFAIHAICIITFLLTEKYREIENPFDKKLKSIQRFIQNSLPLLVTGIIYIVLRNYFIDKTISPISHIDKTQTLFSLPTYLGYSMWGPLFAPWSIGTFTERIAPRLFDLSGSRVWDQLGWTLSILAPLAISFYIWLSFRKCPLHRLAGITALLTSSLHFLIYHSGGVIALRDRYYQFPAFLFIAVASIYLYQKKWKKHMARAILGGTISIGVLGLIHSAFSIKNWAYYNPDSGTSIECPPAVMQSLYSLSSGSEDCILGVSSPFLEAELAKVRHPSTRLLPMYGGPIVAPKSIHGRAPLVILVFPKTWGTGGMDYASCFVDYRWEEWESYEIEDWIFLQAKTSSPNEL